MLKKKKGKSSCQWFTYLVVIHLFHIFKVHFPILDVCSNLVKPMINYAKDWERKQVCLCELVNVV